MKILVTVITKNDLNKVDQNKQKFLQIVIIA